MDSAVSRELQCIDTSWSTPQLLTALHEALTGTGPALSTLPIAQREVDPRVALVVATSGSTSEPKHVALSASALIASARSAHKFLAAPLGARWSLLLPTTHIAGINVLIRAIELGTTPVSIEGKADFTAIVPTQLHSALAGDQQLLEHLRNCRAVLVGGGPLESKLRAEAQEAGIRVVATYGMTESCGGVVYDGTPLAGVEVKVIEGRVAIRAPQVALGYLNAEFPMHDGFFITSDFGELTDGRLRVLGRSDDQIISGGEKISLGLIEEFLRAQFANSEIVAFAKPDEHWGERLCIASTTKLEISEVAQRLKSEFGRHVDPKEIFSVTAIPYLALGKPDRRRLADDFT